MRSLQEKAGLLGRSPQQLHVFDAPGRDDRGWVLSVAHVDVVPWSVVEAVASARAESVCLRPVGSVRGLPFDHDEIVRRAVNHVRGEYLERPDPAGLLPEPFTMRELRVLHDAVAGGLSVSADTFRRSMLPFLREARQRR